MKRPLTFLCLAFLMSVGAARDLEAQDLLIRNVRIVDANRVIERGNIVIRDGRIASTGVGATAEGLEEINAEGMTAMPVLSTATVTSWAGTLRKKPRFACSSFSMPATPH